MKIYIRAAISNILDEDAEVQAEIAENPNTSSDVLEELSHSQYSWVVQRVMLNPNVDTDVLNSYIENISNLQAPTDEVRFLHMLSKKDHLANSTFELLADYGVKHPNSYVAIQLAENKSTPTSALIRLLDYDTHAHAVMDPIIKHPNVTLDILKQLLLEDAGYCGYMNYILSAHQVPVEFLWEFAINGTDADVRAIANCKYAPSDILEYIIETYSDSGYGYTTRDALKNPNLSLDAIQQLDENPENWSSLRHNPNCTSDLLVKFAEDRFDRRDSWALGEIAAHPNCPEELMYRIFDSGIDNAYSGLASNPNIPADLSAKLAQYKYEWKDNTIRLRERIAENPNTAPEVLASLIKSTWEVRAALAKNPNTQLATLTKLSKDKSYQVLQELAENPNISEDIFVRLLNAPRVRWNLERNPNYDTLYNSAFAELEEI